MIKRLSIRYAAKLIALMLICCFMFTTAVAEGRPALLPMMKEWLDKIEGGEAAQITLSATLHNLNPYGEDTVAAMNRLLSECKVQLGYQRNGQGETTQAQLFIGKTTAAGFTVRPGEKMLAQTTLLPGTTLQSGSCSPLDLLLGEGMKIPFWAADILDPNKLADKIPDALNGLSAFAKEKAGSYRLSSKGTAKKAVIYTVPEDSVQLLRDSLISLAGELGWAEASSLLKTMTISGSAEITLYQTSGGKNIGLGIKAAMGFENIAPRKVVFLWAYRSDEKSFQHSFTLKAPAVKGADNLTATGDMSLDCKKSKNRLSLSMDIKNRQGSKNDRTQWTGMLDCLLAEDNQRLEGEITRTYEGPENVNQIFSIKPSFLTTKVDGEVTVKGSARLLWKEGRITSSDVTLSMLADKSAGIAWDETGNTVSLDGMNETDLAAMKEKAQTAAAEAIWRAVLSLPEECLSLITENISREDWERIYQNAFTVVQ